jgi:hypothetical protein
MKDNSYPDPSVPENAQKAFFRWVPGSLENGTLTLVLLNPLIYNKRSFEVFHIFNPAWISLTAVFLIYVFI